MLRPDDLPMIERSIAEIIEQGGYAELEYRIVGSRGVR